MNDCYWSYDKHLFGDARYLLSIGYSSYLKNPDTYGYLLPNLCNLENWRRRDRCLEKCPFALVITEPASIAIRACLADNVYEPYAPDAHLDTSHPLNNKVVDIIAVGTPGSERREACTEETVQDGKNYSGKIVLVKRGGCRFDTKAASVQSGGGVATIIVDHSSANAISFSGVAGVSTGIETQICAKTSRHFGDIILEALDAGHTVRGHLSLSCEALGEDPLPPSDLVNSCPDEALTGTSSSPPICATMENEEDRLCDKCANEIYLENSTHNVSLCLMDHLLQPRVAKNSLVTAATPETGISTGITLASSIEGFMPDPNCKDNDYTEPLTGYSCKDIEDAVVGGSIPDCSWLIQYGFPEGSTQGFMQNCLKTCPRAVGGVGCPGGTGEGCDAADFNNANGKLIAVQRPEGCLPVQMVGLAESKGATGIIFMTRDGDSRAMLIQGLSFNIGIPVHAIDKASTSTLKMWAERTNGTAAAVVRKSTLGAAAVQTPAPTPPPQLQLAGLAGSEDFKFTDAVIISMVFAIVLLIACLVVFILQRINSVSLPRQGSNKGKLSIPLSAASMGLSLSLLMLIAVVGFTLAYQTGKETTDSALDDGWDAVEVTHKNAVLNVEQLKTQLLKSIVDRVEQGINARLDEGVIVTQIVSKLFKFHDGEWETFNDHIKYVTEFSKRFLPKSSWRVGVVTVEGFLSTTYLKTDDRPNASRPDGNPHVSLTNDGNLYGVNQGTYKAGGNIFAYEVPRAVWNVRNSLGRVGGVDLLEYMRDKKKMSTHWWPTVYSSPAQYEIFEEFEWRPLYVACPVHSARDDYLGSAFAWSEIEWFGTFLARVTTSKQTANMTVVVFDSSGDMVFSSKGRSYKTVDSYGASQGTHSSDWITDPISLEFSHPVEINAAGNYVRRTFMNNSLGNLDAINANSYGEFDQADFYGSSNNVGEPAFEAFKLTFDDNTLTDKSGEGWKTGLSGNLAFTSGAANSARALELDGQSTLEVYLNLTVDIPRVAARRNASADNHRAEYDSTMALPNGDLAVAFTWFNYKTNLPDTTPLTRESLLQQSFSIALWVKPYQVIDDNAWVSATSPRLFSDTLNSPASVRLFANGKLVITSLSKGYGCETAPIPGGPTVNSWTHIAAVVDRVYRPTDAQVIGASLQTVQMCRVFVNGLLHSETPLGAQVTLQDTLELKPEPYRIGQFLNGAIDEFIMMNNTLTEREVQSIRDRSRLSREVPRRKWYIQVSRVKYDNLNWGIAGMIPRDDIMRQVDHLNDLQRQNQTIRRSNTENKLTQKSSEAMIIIVAIALASILVFLVFNEMLTRPFAMFARQMTDVAVMKVEEVETETSSVLREIDSMHRAMQLMVRNLMEYKKYMPQTMLAMNESDEEDDETEKGATASVVSESTRGGAQKRSSVSPPGSHKSRASRASSMRSNSRLAQTQVSHNVGRARKADAAMKVGSMAHKRCTFVVIAVKGLHSVVGKIPDGELVVVHMHVLEHILAAFATSKGVPDTFCGDRAFCSFNAVRMVSTHRVSACAAVENVRNKLLHPIPHGRDKSTTIRVSAGVTSGEARVGNLGTDVMRRFSYIAPVITWCYALERYCRLRECRALLDNAVKDEAKNSFTLRFADSVLFPKRRDKATPVYELIEGKQQAEEEEWMYQLEKQDECGWKSWDVCMEAVVDGNWDTALEKKDAALQMDTLGADGCTSELGKRLESVISDKAFSTTEIMFH